MSPIKHPKIQMAMKTWGLMLLAGVVLTASLMGTSPVGEAMFAVKLTNVNATGTTVSFGVTSAKIAIVTPSTNTAEICLHWTGAVVASCPATNTAGDDLIPAGTQIIVDDISVPGIGISAASGTQTVYIRAWR